MSVAYSPRVEATSRRRGRLSFGNVSVVICGSVLALTIVCAIAPGLIAPQDPLSQSLLNRMLPPGSRSPDGTLYLLGTDPLGRDVLSRMIHGARISMSIALASVVVSSVIGVPLGIYAGYRGGRLESVVMRFVDAMLSFPVLVLMMFFLFVLGGGVLSMILVLAIMRWVAYTRVARSLTLTYRSAAFIEAAKSVGCGDARIMFRHILPNILSPILVLATLELALVMLAEASLSFLGLGVQPPTPSWGSMVSDGRDYLTSGWWIVMLPGLAIFGVTLSLNILASAARDTPDRQPRLVRLRAMRAASRP